EGVGGSQVNRHVAATETGDVVEDAHLEREVESSLPLSALTLALGSAVLHAVWNLLLGRARDVQAATAATFVLSLALALPFALVWWHADGSVWPYALASGVLEAVYVVALALAYRRGGSRRQRRLVRARPACTAPWQRGGGARGALVVGRDRDGACGAVARGARLARPPRGLGAGVRRDRAAGGLNCFSVSRIRRRPG